MGQALCGTQVCSGFQGEATLVYGTNRRGTCFLTAGDMNIMIWFIDKIHRSISGVAVNLNKLRRTILCMDLDERDEMCYCGTSTGDVLKIKLNFHHDPDILTLNKKPSIVGCFARISNKKLPKGKVDLYENGIRAIKRLANGDLVIGAGDGTIEIVVEAKKRKVELPPGISTPSIPGLQILKTQHLKTMITSINILKKQLLVATVKCEIFSIDMETFKIALLFTCHTDTIYDISFP